MQKANVHLLRELQNQVLLLIYKSSLGPLFLCAKEHELQQLIISAVGPKYMIVNKVVLLISTTRAGEEELISEISGCCLCLATLGPQWAHS